MTFLGSFARLRFFEMLQKRRKEKDSKPNIYLLSTVSLQPKRFIWFPWFLFVGFPGFTLAYYSITPSNNQVLWDSLRNCAWNIITFFIGYLYRLVQCTSILESVCLYHILVLIKVICNNDFLIKGKKLSYFLQGGRRCIPNDK